jgi:hypothetical protein
MTTPSGQISLNDVNVELGIAGTTTIQMNQANVRTLAGVGGSGTTISMQNLQNKTNRVAISSTFSSNTANATLNLSAIGGYISGKSDITVTINSGVYLYATSTGNYGLSLSGGTTGDTLTIVNNGFILGQGGTGSNTGSGSAGGPALNLGFGMSACTINNTNGSAYIGGGGGGGGYSGFGTSASGGGGGAGGGSSSGGGAGGAIGSVGANGSTTTGSGGGRIFPGTGGAGASPGVPSSSTGGGAGGGGGGAVTGGKTPTYATGGNGGAGPSGGAASANGAGGGGGWGASGGSGRNGSGGAGGKAVNLNGKSLTWTSGNVARVYGAVS